LIGVGVDFEGVDDHVGTEVDGSDDGRMTGCGLIGVGVDFEGVDDHGVTVGFGAGAGIGLGIGLGVGFFMEGRLLGSTTGFGLTGAGAGFVGVVDHDGGGLTGGPDG